MSKKSRDDFSKPTKRKLRDMVAGRCSNPDCDVPTMASKRGENEPITTGKAAHICAAAIGGPRYDAAMSNIERSSYDNGIWLCSPCSELIDKDETFYTKEKLIGWKTNAVEKARTRLDKRQPTDEDAVNMISYSLSGAGNRLNRVAAAVHNVVHASVKTLKEKDPRFNVSLSIIDNNAAYTIEPENGSVPLWLQVPDCEAESFSKKVSRLIECGETLTASTESIKLCGSPLLDELLGCGGGEIIIEAPRKSAKHTCELSNGTSTLHLEPFIGTISVGSKQIKFEGSAYGGFLTLKSVASVLFDKETKSRFIFSFNLEGWEGENVTSLSYFDDLYTLTQHLSNDWVFSSKHYIEGKLLYSGSANFLENEREFFQDVFALLRYIELSREISKRLRLDIRFTRKVIFSDEVLQRMESIIQILDGEEIERDFGSAPIKVEFDTKETAWLTEKVEESHEGSVAWGIPFNDKIKLFGEEIMLPTMHVVLNQAAPKILSKVETEKGFHVELVFNRLPNFKASVKQIGNP